MLFHRINALVRLLGRRFPRRQARNHLNVLFILLLLLALDVIHTRFDVTKLRQDYATLFAFPNIIAVLVAKEGRKPKKNRKYTTDNADNDRKNVHLSNLAFKHPDLLP